MPGQVVVLEDHPLGLEAADEVLDVVAHGPGGRGRLVGPGELRLIDDERARSRS